MTEPSDHKKGKTLGVKITDDVLKGLYANGLVVRHTREEFILDFVNVFPPEGIVNARIIISPGHLKRLIKTLHNNLSKYESKHGEVAEAPEPGRGEIVH